MSKLELAIKSGKATIIDVRSRAEYATGHVVDSLNIPMDEITERLNEIKKMQVPIVLCCASGGRSALAMQMLKTAGISEIYNGGPWVDVNYIKNN